LAAASLKPHVPKHPMPDVVVFSRPFGRGLIEAMPETDSGRAYRSFPRPFGRGLIEALLALTNGDGRPTFPRPFGRGLIEAASAWFDGDLL
jgi:hypothetical protein